MGGDVVGRVRTQDRLVDFTVLVGRPDLDDVLGQAELRTGVVAGQMLDAVGEVVLAAVAQDAGYRAKEELEGCQALLPVHDGPRRNRGEPIRAHLKEDRADEVSVGASVGSGVSPGEFLRERPEVLPQGRPLVLLVPHIGTLKRGASAGFWGRKVHPRARISHTGPSWTTP